MTELSVVLLFSDTFSTKVFHPAIMVGGHAS